MNTYILFGLFMIFNCITFIFGWIWATDIAYRKALEVVNKTQPKQRTLADDVADNYNNNSI